MRGFTLVGLRSNREIAFKNQMQEEGRHCYIPLMRVRQKVRHKHNSIVVQRPLFPGYGFLFIYTQDDIEIARKKIGFQYSFICENKLVHIDDDVIESLKSREASGEFDKTQNAKQPRSFAVGETIHIKDGALLGYCGVVIKLFASSALVEVRNKATKISLLMIEKF